MTPAQDAHCADSMKACQEHVSIAFDQSRAPLIRVTLDGVISDADVGTYLSESDLIVAAGRRYGLVYDGMRPFEVTARQRKIQSDWIRQNYDSLAKLCVGAAFAFESMTARGTLTAVLWMAKLPFEYTIVKSMLDGQLWVSERLRRAGALPT